MVLGSLQLGAISCPVARKMARLMVPALPPLPRDRLGDGKVSVALEPARSSGFSRWEISSATGTLCGGSGVKPGNVCCSMSGGGSWLLTARERVCANMHASERERSACNL